MLENPELFKENALSEQVINSLQFLRNDDYFRIYYDVVDGQKPNKKRYDDNEIKNVIIEQNIINQSPTRKTEVFSDEPIEYNLSMNLNRSLEIQEEILD